MGWDAGVSQQREQVLRNGARTQGFRWRFNGTRPHLEVRELGKWEGDGGPTTGRGAVFAMGFGFYLEGN